VKTTPYALDFLTLKKYKDVFIKNNILTERELDARYEIQNHSYVMKIDIEAKTLADLAVNQILPSALDYSNKLISNIKGLKEIGIAASGSKAQKEIVTDIVNRINAVKTGVDKLNAALAGAHKSKSVSDEAKYYCDKVKPLFDDIRDNIDSLELLVEDTSWPLPKYREMLFMR
jgi:glutamine synthetase